MENNQIRTAAIIVAAGESQRMTGIDKVLATLGGEPILVRASRPFQECPLVHRIVVVANRKNKARCQHLMGGGEWSKVSDVYLGGKRRQDSVLAGLKQLKNYDWVIIHDGARPLVTADLIERGLEAAGETGAAIAAVPMTDTVKVAGDDKIVGQTLPRDNLWTVQTPQIFRFDIITKAYHCIKNEVTDDASLVEQLGYKVKLYMGSNNNIKISTLDDMALAEKLWRERR